MNKLSKIFLVIIIILIIALGIAVNSYIKMQNYSLQVAQELYRTTKAIEDAGLKCEVQDDNSIMLVKRETPIERTID